MRARFACIMALVPSLMAPGPGIAQSAFTDARDHRPTDPFAISSCSDAASREAQSRNPMATGFTVTSSDVSPTGNTRSDVSGKGTFRTAAGQTGNFTFRCTYDLQKSAVSDVTVFLQ
jgi:hypothetical protein